MNISYRWLKRYLPIDLNPELVSELLTDTGLEVEGLEEVETIPGGLRGVVVGEVLTCIQHPNADRLRITTVEIGAEEAVQIVCGAPNVAAGQKVIHLSHQFRRIYQEHIYTSSKHENSDK